MRWLAWIVALALVGVVMTAALRAAPPSAADQQAAAARLETAVTLVTETGIGIWLDDRDCRMLLLDLDQSYADPAGGACATDHKPFTPGAQATFDRLAAAVTGAVRGALVRIVSVSEDFTDVATGAAPARRSITFEVAPQVLGAFDSPLETWQWTWSEDPRPGVRQPVRPLVLLRADAERGIARLQPPVSGTPTVSIAAAMSATRGSASAVGDHAKNTRVEPWRRMTNCVSRGYWIAPVPDAR